VSFRGFVREVRRHASQFFTNWRTYDAPVWTKLRLALRNRVSATFSRRQCCGHLGEPGC
jgi:hypothetical protein